MRLRMPAMRAHTGQTDPDRRWSHHVRPPD
nr:MAG TPA: hypothetical protein [Caudoviricetes sp.]